MKYTEKEIRTAAIDLIETFGELLTWRWEEEKSVLLAEFASGKADKVNAILHQKFSHNWDRKSLKNAPESIKNELGIHARIIKEQRIFTNSPQGDDKSVAALLWPWGHGSTLSLRLTLIETPYTYTKPQPSNNPVAKLFKKMKSALA